MYFERLLCYYLFTAFNILLLIPVAHSAVCPPDGPLLPRPTSLHTSPLISSASQNLKSTLDKAVTGKLTVPWLVPNISFSIAVVSLDTPNPSSPLWEYHHLATANTRGTKHVDGDSQYLIGSISKMITDLLLLKVGLPLDDPITKYLPELLSPDSPIRWDEITLGSLGDHLSGMPYDYGFPEIWEIVPYFQSLGFPVLPPSDWPNCNVIDLNPGCTKQQLLEDLKSAHPIAAPNLRPHYSSLSFQILSYAMTAATGKNYTQLLQENILGPLRMANTGASPGDDAKAVIPSTDNTWGADYGEGVPGGGLYSSTHDLSALLSSIISLKSPILPRAQILKWLKPTSTTTHLNTLVGRPWEIYRTQNLTPAHPHTIDLYTKGGAALGYEGIIAVVEQYGLGFVILTAGALSVEAQDPLAGAVLGAFMPAIEEAARKEAEAYLGKYTTGEKSDVKGEMSIVIDDGPGLRLKGLSRNGSDIMLAISTLWDAQLVSLGKLSSEMRLYPTDISKEIEVGHQGHSKKDTDTDKRILVEEDWRLQYDTVEEVIKSDLPSWIEKDSQCVQWWTADAIFYAGESVDRFVFVREGHSGKIVEARIPSLRLNFTVHV